MNEQFSFLSRLQEWQMGFSHAYEIDPDMEDGFLYEIAQAQMVRECFPKAPIKHKPPTRHKTGDIFYSHLMDGLFSMVGVMTHQDIQELGTATEAVHHPLLMDRYWSLKAANYILKNTRSLGDEIQWSANGKVVRRARSLLEGAYRLLQKIEKTGGLFSAIRSGQLANVSRNPDVGLGQEGALGKDKDYFNPIWEALRQRDLSNVVISPASHRRYASYRPQADRDNDRGHAERGQRRGSRNERGDRGKRGERGSRPERSEKAASGRGSRQSSRRGERRNTRQARNGRIPDSETKLSAEQKELSQGQETRATNEERVPIEEVSLDAKELKATTAIDEKNSLVSEVADTAQEVEVSLEEDEDEFVSVDDGDELAELAYELGDSDDEEEDIEDEESLRGGGGAS